MEVANSHQSSFSRSSWQSLSWGEKDYVKGEGFVRGGSVGALLLQTRCLPDLWVQLSI
jgi:hypothetical protein